MLAVIATSATAHAAGRDWARSGGFDRAAQLFRAFDRHATSCFREHQLNSPPCCWATLRSSAACRRTQNVGERAQQRIAAGVTVGVVPVLEVIGVDEKQRDARERCEPRAFEQASQPFAQRARREQPGQRVVFRAPYVAFTFVRERVGETGMFGQGDDALDRVGAQPRCGAASVDDARAGRRCATAAPRPRRHPPQWKPRAPPSPERRAVDFACASAGSAQRRSARAIRTPAKYITGSCGDGDAMRAGRLLPRRAGRHRPPARRCGWHSRSTPARTASTDRGRGRDQRQLHAFDQRGEFPYPRPVPGRGSGDSNCLGISARRRSGSTITASGRPHVHELVVPEPVEPSVDGLARGVADSCIALFLVRQAQRDAGPVVDAFAELIAQVQQQGREARADVLRGRGRDKGVGGPQPARRAR